METLALGSNVAPDVHHSHGLTRHLALLLCHTLLFSPALHLFLVASDSHA